MRFTLLLVASLGVGCGGSSKTTDGSTDGNTITIDTQGTTFDLLAYKDGDAWKTPTMTASGFELTVHGPYVLAAVCTTPTYYAQTLSDPHTLTIACQKNPTMFAVTGQMVQAGEVGVGPDVDESADPNWSFNVPVTAGTYNVAAFSTDRVELRRDVSVTAALALTPAFDVTAGAALVTTPFTITNTTPQENHNAIVKLRSTHGDMTVFTGPTARAKVLPPSLLVSGEVHRVALAAGNATSGRVLERDWHMGDPTTFTLPPGLDKVVYTATATSLVATPPMLPSAFDTARLTVGGSVSVVLQFTRSYVDAATTLTIDETAPGFQDAWKTDFTKPYTATLLVQHMDGGDLLTQTSSVVPGV